MNEIFALAIKDLRLMARDRVGMIFAFGLPLIYASFFGTIFSGEGSAGTSAIKIAVVDEDATQPSRAFVATLEEASEFDVLITDRENATSLVRRGKLVAFIALVPGFGEARERMFFGDPPRIEVGIDPARKAEAGMLQGVLARCMFEGIQDLFTNPDVIHSRIDGWLGDLKTAKGMDPVDRLALQLFLPALDNLARSLAGQDAGVGADDASKGEAKAWQPMVIETVSIQRKRHGPANAYAISFPQGITWGVLGCSAAFGLSLVTERVRGTLVRLRMAPIARWKILAGKGTACFVATTTMMVTLLVIGAIVFGVRPGSIPLLALAVVSVSISFVGLMMFLSVLGKTEQAAGGIGWGVLLMFAMLGGGMIPLFFMPPWLKTLSHVSPVKWAILAMEGAIWREFTLSEMMLPCGILIGAGIVFFAIGTWAFRWTAQE